MPLHVTAADSDVNTPTIVRLQLSVIDGAPGATANAGQATVDPAAAGAVQIGALIVIVLFTGAKALPHKSVAIHVSVIAPLQSGDALKLDGFEVPLIKHPLLNPLLKDNEDGAGKLEIHAIEVAAGAVIVGNAAGLTVIVLDTATIVLPHTSVAVQVSVTSPPHAPGVAVNVDGFDVPLIEHPPVNPLENEIVLAVGTAPHATVIPTVAVIVDKAAGLTVIV